MAKKGKGKDKNHISFWFWFFALFVLALPCIGVVMTIIWALAGQNESKKNYFRAIIAWFVILTVVWLVIMLLGFSPLIIKQLQTWLHRVQR